MSKQEFTFDYAHYAPLDALPESDRELAARAADACGMAYAPYSGFRVGAAALLEDGTILTASNQESEVFPAGMCAERSLLFHAGACHADDPIEALAIASEPSERECYPCGQCRQVLLDAERRQRSPIRIIISGAGGATVVDSAVRLLPFTFQL